MTATEPLADSSKPTGLKPVLAVIPDHCYERSTARGLLLIARDFAVYGAGAVGLGLNQQSTSSGAALAAGRAGGVGALRARS